MAVPPLEEELAALESWLDMAEQQLYKGSVPPSPLLYTPTTPCHPHNPLSPPPPSPQHLPRVSQVEAASGSLLAAELVEVVGRLREEYRSRGFMKRRVQEGMEEWRAARPYASALYFTLREKNNTVMNFLR